MTPEDGLLHFVLIQHFVPACAAAGWFACGVVAAIPSARWGPARFGRIPLALFRWVLRVMGPRPSLARMTVTIFCFNGAAICLYMATGARPWIPSAVAALTGFNVTLVSLRVGAGESRGPEGIHRGSGPGGWVPGRAVTALCGLLVVLLELAGFCFALGMGIRLGEEVAAGRMVYIEGLLPRLHAYVALILPALLVSAWCEAVAIRGMEARNEAG